MLDSNLRLYITFNAPNAIALKGIQEWFKLFRDEIINHKGSMKITREINDFNGSSWGVGFTIDSEKNLKDLDEKIRPMLVKGFEDIFKSDTETSTQFSMTIISGPIDFS